MKFYTEKGRPSSDVYIWLGAIYLRIGKFEDYLVHGTFEVKKYIDYHGVTQGPWSGYAWTKKEDSNMVEIDKTTVKEWNVYLHQEMYSEVICLIFEKNS